MLLTGLQLHDVFNLQLAAKSLPYLLTNTLFNSHLTIVFPLCLSSVLSGPGEEMGAKASLVQGLEPSSTLVPSPTLENIQAAYEDGEEEVARELIQQACCVECSAGAPNIDGVSAPKIEMTVTLSTTPLVGLWSLLY